MLHRNLFLQLVEKEFDGFQRIFNKFIQGSGGIEWDKIEKLPNGAVKDYKSLSAPSDSEIKSMLSKLVVVKLNGGLGTSMGCTGPKSVIPVSCNTCLNKQLLQLIMLES